jgi:hypothetical protein
MEKPFSTKALLGDLDDCFWQAIHSVLEEAHRLAGLVGLRDNLLLPTQTTRLPVRQERPLTGGSLMQHQNLNSNSSWSHLDQCQAYDKQDHIELKLLSMSIAQTRAGRVLLSSSVPRRSCTKLSEVCV